VRQVLVGLFVIAACGGHTPEPVHNGAGSNAPSGSNTAPIAMGSAVGSAAIVPEVGCPNPTCAFHAGAGSYFTCLSGGAGICFHFGGPCAPSDGCMFDPQTRAYRSCAKPVEGSCAQWSTTTTTCAPANACMFDPDDGMHHHCEQISGGSCAKYGALCAP
jgi:hypothetical protein